MLRFAAAQLARNKGRTALTAVGVAVGVFAFTTIVAIGRGLERAVIDQLTDDESPTRIVVRPGFGALPGSIDAAVEGVSDPAKADRLRKSIAKRRRGGPGPTRRTQLTPDTVLSLIMRPHVVSARPLVVDRFELTLGEHRSEVALSYGVAPDDPRWNARVIAGQPFEARLRGVWLHEYLLYEWGYRSDEEQAALVGGTALLRRPGQAVGMLAMLDAARRSGLDLPIDTRLLEMFARAQASRPQDADTPPEDGAAAGAVELPILGIVRERVEDDGFEVWEDSFSMQADVFMPQGLAQDLFLQDPGNLTRGYAAVALEVDSAEHLAAVEDALQAEGWRTVSVRSILERLTRALAVITVIVSSLTGVAVLVAVLGIVNTMIMNVSERTREIGTLKALGATDGQVRGLFVAESALIGLMGGLAGVACALGGSFPGDWAARTAIRRITEYSYPGSIFAFPAWLIVAALGFAVLLSVLAALGPARVASRVDPVVALRDE